MVEMNATMAHLAAVGRRPLQRVLRQAPYLRRLAERVRRPSHPERIRTKMMCPQTRRT